MDKQINIDESDRDEQQSSKIIELLEIIDENEKIKQSGDKDTSDSSLDYCSLAGLDIEKSSISACDDDEIPIQDLEPYASEKLEQLTQEMFDNFDEISASLISLQAKMMETFVDPNGIEKMPCLDICPFRSGNNQCTIDDDDIETISTKLVDEISTKDCHLLKDDTPEKYSFDNIKTILTSITAESTKFKADLNSVEEYSCLGLSAFRSQHYKKYSTSDEEWMPMSRRFINTPNNTQFIAEEFSNSQWFRAKNLQGNGAIKNHPLAMYETTSDSQSSADYSFPTYKSLRKDDVDMYSSSDIEIISMPAASRKKKSCNISRSTTSSYGYLDTPIRPKMIPQRPQTPMETFMKAVAFKVDYAKLNSDQIDEIQEELLHLVNAKLRIFTNDTE